MDLTHFFHLSFSILMHQRHLTDLDIIIIIPKSKIEVTNFPKDAVRNRSNTRYMNWKNRQLIMLSGFLLCNALTKGGNQVNWILKYANIGTSKKTLVRIKYINTQVIGFLVRVSFPPLPKNDLPDMPVEQFLDSQCFDQWGKLDQIPTEMGLKCAAVS